MGKKKDKILSKNNNISNLLSLLGSDCNTNPLSANFTKGQTHKKFTQKIRRHSVLTILSNWRLKGLIHTLLTQLYRMTICKCL